LCPPPVGPIEPTAISESAATISLHLQTYPVIRTANSPRRPKRLPIATIGLVIGLGLFVALASIAAVVLSLNAKHDQTAIGRVQGGNSLGGKQTAEDSLKSKLIAVQKEVATADVSRPLSLEQTGSTIPASDANNRFHGPDDGLKRAIVNRFGMPKLVLMNAVAEAQGVPQSRRMFEENLISAVLPTEEQLSERVREDLRTNDMEDLLGAYALYLGQARLWLEFEEYESALLDKTNAPPREKQRILAVYADYRKTLSTKCQQRASLIFDTALAGVDSFPANRTQQAHPPSVNSKAAPQIPVRNEEKDKRFGMTKAARSLEELLSMDDGPSDFTHKEWVELKRKLYFEGKLGTKETDGVFEFRNDPRNYLGVIRALRNL